MCPETESKERNHKERKVHKENIDFDNLFGSFLAEGVLDRRYVINPYSRADCLYLLKRP